MNRKSALVLCVTAAILLLAVPAVVADQEVEIGKAKMLDMPRDVRVGDVMLPRGQYRVRHFQRGDEHIMAFETLRGKELARVPCTMEALPQKASGPEFRYRQNKAGEYILTELTFRGDAVAHKF